VPGDRSQAPAKTGPSGLDAFARLGVRREIDLLLHLPLRYEDLTVVVPIAATRAGDSAQVEGTVRTSRVDGRPRRMLRVELEDDSGLLTLRFLHFTAVQQRQFAPGARVRAYGEVRASLFGNEIVHPRYRLVGDGSPIPQQLTPIYPTVAGIGQGLIRSAIARRLRSLSLPETVPAGVIARLGLPALTDALKLLHAPPPDASTEALEERSLPAWRRVIFDELLAQQLSLRRARAARADLRAGPLRDGTLAERLAAALPFALTAAQRRATSEVAHDLALEQPMNRLLQGDVGSGKTVVAALAACQAIGSGSQVAMMAPTEILAEQHLRKLGPWLEPLGVRVGWLAGSLREADKRAVRAAVEAGTIDLLVGTHALIEESVKFARLGLSIIDEQHRFGVAQRLSLRERAALLAHQLMMSATPIPRSLAMSYYADLDVSVIDELPPGRTPVVTRLVSDARRDEIVERVRVAADDGRQVYWVCPLIEESEALELQTAIDTHAALSEALGPIEVGLLHGRLAPAEKQQVMRDFSEARIKVLVATTVIEVGVDVPNASLMVIEHAERFGLAQLHQLRGRVGRGAQKSICVLLYHGPLSQSGRERLRAMHETTDGFEIARRDLRLRGPGEFLGARQSGQSMLRFADLDRDADLVEVARDCASHMLIHEPQQVEAHITRWLGAREAFLKA
jgi:ATP-dependent DNA helicase RecG